MTMLETKKAIEDALFLNNPLSFDAMMNAYIAVQAYINRCGDRDITITLNADDVLKGESNDRSAIDI